MKQNNAYMLILSSINLADILTFRYFAYPYHITAQVERPRDRALSFATVTPVSNICHTFCRYA